MSSLCVVPVINPLVSAKSPSLPSRFCLRNIGTMGTPEAKFWECMNPPRGDIVPYRVTVSKADPLRNGTVLLHSLCELALRGV